MPIRMNTHIEKTKCYVSKSIAIAFKIEKIFHDEMHETDKHRF